MQIEKKLGDDTYILNTQNQTLDYTSHEGNISIKLDEEVLDFDVGRIGDGCGAGRIFLLFATEIKAFNPENQEYFEVVQELNQATSIEKNGCDLFIEDADGKYIFNLAMMKRYNL